LPAVRGHPVRTAPRSENHGSTFTKFHGYGNDYLVFEAEQLAKAGDLGDFARRICNRHYGAGADGIAIVATSTEDSS